MESEVCSAAIKSIEADHFCVAPNSYIHSAGLTP